MAGRIHDDLSLLVYDMTNKWNALKAKLEKESASISASTRALLCDFEAPFKVVVKQVHKLIEIHHHSKGQEVPRLNQSDLSPPCLDKSLRLLQELKGMLLAENFLGTQGELYGHRKESSEEFDDEALMKALKKEKSNNAQRTQIESRRQGTNKQSKTKTVESWELLLDKNFVAHRESIWALAIAQGFLFSGSHDGTIKKWCMKTYTCLKEIKAHSDAVLGLISLEEILVTGSADCKVCIFSTDELALLEKHDKHSQRVGALEVIGRRFATGSADDCICIWRQISDGKKSWTCDRVLRGHTDSVLVLKHSNDFLYSGSCDKSICIWSTTDWRLLSRIEGHKGSVLGITTLSRFVISCSEEGCIEVRDSDQDWRIVSSSHQDKVSVTFLASCGSFIITTGEDHNMRMWMFANGEIKCVGTRILPGPVSSMISDGSSAILVASYTGEVTRWIIKRYVDTSV
uniref:Uncharacterized protein n=1 Tax=Guillardia theta TaxID=55529 RepID=A0A7S4JDF8_GUITH|mmetsp:Transcript_15185/g.51208  ORF Transcript_15185/g.51208 Transcript_15185/m.51208 type:complete len:458 (+) Transcript_15185:104-1477(+)